MGPPYLDGLPMEYWIVPPRSPLATVIPPFTALKPVYRSDASLRTPADSARHADSTFRWVWMS